MLVLTGRLGSDLFYAARRHRLTATGRRLLNFITRPELQQNVLIVSRKTNLENGITNFVSSFSMGVRRLIGSGFSSRILRTVTLYTWLVIYLFLL